MRAADYVKDSLGFGGEGEAFGATGRKMNEDRKFFNPVGYWLRSLYLDIGMYRYYLGWIDCL